MGHRHTTAACRNAVPRQDLPLLHPRRHHLQRRQVGQPNALHVLYGTMVRRQHAFARNASDSASGDAPIRVVIGQNIALGSGFRNRGQG